MQQLIHHFSQNAGNNYVWDSSFQKCLGQNTPLESLHPFESPGTTPAMIQAQHQFNTLEL